MQNPKLVSHPSQSLVAGSTTTLDRQLAASGFEQKHQAALEAFTAEADSDSELASGSDSDSDDAGADVDHDVRSAHDAHATTAGADAADAESPAPATAFSDAERAAHDVCDGADVRAEPAASAGDGVGAGEAAAAEVGTPERAERGGLAAGRGEEEGSDEESGGEAGSGDGSEGGGEGGAENPEGRRVQRRVVNQNRKAAKTVAMSKVSRNAQKAIGKKGRNAAALASQGW